MLQLVHISKIIRNFASEKVMMSVNKRNLTEKEEYYKLITDEKSNHIGTNANGAGSQCVRRKNIGSLSIPTDIKKSRHEPDNSSDRGHPNPNKWNTSIVLCAKIDIISERCKFFSNFICSSTPKSTIFNTFNTNCITIVTIIRTITSFSNWIRCIANLSFFSKLGF